MKDILEKLKNIKQSTGFWRKWSFLPMKAHTCWGEPGGRNKALTHTCSQLHGQQMATASAKSTACLDIAWTFLYVNRDHQ